MTSEAILAHGLGGRADLPVPTWLALFAGVLAVLVSFFALAALWTEPKLRGSRAGTPLPAGIARVVDARATRVLLQLIGVLLLALLLATAWFGTDSSASNPAATWFYVWFWVALVPLSLALGPIWRRLNPLRTLAAGLRALPPLRDGGRWRRALPERVGYWPATVGLLAFLWLELVYGESDSPRAIAVFVTAYVLVHVAAGSVFGRKWFDHGESFEVYFGLIAALSPFGRRDDGALVVRNPLDGLLTIQRSEGLTPVVLVVLGSTAFDGLTRLPLWGDVTEGSKGVMLALLGTAGLAGAIIAIAGIYTGGIWLTRPYLRRNSDGQAFEPYSAFAHSLVPIMIGYTVAHYFSFAVFQGQAGLLLASDPFGLGWDLFGTAEASIDYTVVGAATIAFVQVAGIVVGHILGVTSAHDRAIGVLRPKYVKVGQYPMLAVMVAYTATGIALVAGV
ncbi:hypothetical protein [Haloechinothrix halophila]|uniref:hypothetical protein n=1 Tax=Haloechinothrix halophila TaxID=1069073 RepID=UPI0004167BD3|nr:hypothetical protein [Haloechinothrix halophila]